MHIYIYIPSNQGFYLGVAVGYFLESTASIFENPLEASKENLVRAKMMVSCVPIFLGVAKKSMFIYLYVKIYVYKYMYICAQNLFFGMIFPQSWHVGLSENIVPLKFTGHSACTSSKYPSKRWCAP